MNMKSSLLSLKLFIFFFLFISIQRLRSDDRVLISEDLLSLQKRSWNQDKDSYLQQDPIYNKVTSQFGSLIIQKKMIDGKIYTYEGKKKPWSSWWFPTFQKELFWDGKSRNNSPLGKYDRFVEALTSSDPDAVGFEEKTLYNPRAQEWDGLCYSWSIASLIHPEPVKAITKEDITFSIKDQKALILKSYEEMSNIEMYGERNNGEWNNVYADIFPEQFHRFVEHYLINKGESFVMDSDASFQVWNVPVYKIQLKMTLSELDPNVIDVSMWTYNASPHVSDPNSIGTLEVVRNFTYKLYIKKQDALTAEIDRGEWTERSRWDHPDYVLWFQGNNPHKSLNSQLKNEYVGKILGISKF